jgi:hypothetical protein
MCSNTEMPHQWNAAEILMLISTALIAVEATLARRGAPGNGESLAAR